MTVTTESDGENCHGYDDSNGNFKLVDESVAYSGMLTWGKSNPGNIDKGVAGRGQGRRFSSPSNEGPEMFGQLICCTRVLSPILWLNSFQ